jgi:hypothetical protein
MKGGCIKYRLCVLLMMALFFFMSSYAMKEVKAQETKPLTKEEGVAKDGEFERTAKPAFTFEYPKNFIMEKLLPFEVFRGKSPTGVPSVNISVNKFDVDPKKDIDEQLKAWVEGSVKGWEAAFKNVYKSKKIVVNYIRPTDRYEGYKAYEFEIEWMWTDGSTMLTSYVNVIYKEGYVISLGGTVIGDIEQLKGIYDTIDLEP